MSEIYNPDYLDIKTEDTESEITNVIGEFGKEMNSLEESIREIKAGDAIYLGNKEIGEVAVNGGAMYGKLLEGISVKDGDKVNINGIEMGLITGEDGKVYLNTPGDVMASADIPEVVINASDMLLAENNINVRLGKNLNKELLIKTINDTINGGNPDQVEKAQMVVNLLQNGNSTPDKPSDMVKKFQEQELQLRGVSIDGIFGGNTFEATKKWMGIVPKNWINTGKTIDFDGQKEIYSASSKNLINPETGLILKFSDGIGVRFNIKENCTLQNLNSLKNFVLFNNGKIIIPNRFAKVINGTDENGNIYEPNLDMPCNWEMSTDDNGKKCLSISQNGVQLSSIPFEFIA